MSEFEQDAQVADLLVAAADEAATFIRPQGVDAVVRTVRRRRTRTPIVAALILVAVFAPLTVLGLTGRHAPDTPTGGHPSTSANAAPSESPAPSDSATPSASASPLPSGSPSGPTAPDGHISASQLRNSTLQIPAWPGPNGFDGNCPAGTVKFTGGEAGQGDVALQGDPVYADVDHDGAPETVVLVSCESQGHDYQVLALDRDTTGKVVTLGKVVGSAGVAGKDGTDIKTIWAIGAGDNGQVRVDVGDYRPCCATAQASQHQWRTYGWNGNGFTQTGGPTAFGPNPNVTDLVTTADPLTMTKQADGSWTGSLRVTIHNAATYATPGRLGFSLNDVPENWQADPGADCRQDDFPGVTCTLPSLGAGATEVLTVEVTAPPGTLIKQCYVFIGAVDAKGNGYPDRKPGGSLETNVQVIGG